MTKEIHLNLDDLQRSLREIASQGEEQIVGTVRSITNYAIDMFETYASRRKTADIDVTRKENTNEVSEPANIKIARIQPSNYRREATQFPGEPDPWGDDNQALWEPENSDLRVPLQVQRKSSAIDREFDGELPLGRDEQDDFTTWREEEVDVGSPNEEILYDFNSRDGASFKAGINGVEAQAILDLISGIEGTRVNNGENLLITSNGKKLFETDAEGQIVFSIAQRDRNFKRRGNPTFNSIEDLREKATAIVRNEQAIKDDIQIFRTETEYPDRVFERVLSNSTTARVAAGEDGSLSANPQVALDNRDKVESLLYLRDCLPEEGKEYLADRAAFEAEKLGNGIVQVKMYELDNPQPVVIGKVDERGQVLLDREYTAPRYSLVKEVIKNQQLAKGLNGKTAVAAPQIATDDRPDSQVEAPGHTILAKTGLDLSGNERQATTDIAVGRQQLLNLHAYYQSPQGKSLPASSGFKERFNQYKARLLQAGKDVTQNKKLKFADDFFDGFQSEDVGLSPADRSHLSAADDFAANQSQENSTKREITKNVRRG